MNEFFECLGLAVLVLTVLGLMFLFEGDPSVWTVWQNSLKGACK